MGCLRNFEEVRGQLFVGWGILDYMMKSIFQSVKLQPRKTIVRTGAFPSIFQCQA